MLLALACLPFIYKGNFQLLRFGPNKITDVEFFRFFFLICVYGICLGLFMLFLAVRYSHI